MINLEALNYKFAYLENKFWSVNSILVPESAPVIDESFKGIHEIFKDYQNLFTNIYWSAINVIGEIKLPGEWNYCYLDGKGFHMVKTKSDGIFKDSKGVGQEFFYYQLIYDDWVNEFLTNSVNVSGSVIKTGDEEKVKTNIHRTAPLIQNLNHLDEFDCSKSKKENSWTFNVPAPQFYTKNTFRWLHPITLKLINNFLSSGYERNFNSEENVLRLPFMAEEIRTGNWKTAIVTSLIEYINTGVAIYDASKTNLNYASFISKYRAISSDDTQDSRIYVLAKVAGVKQVADTYVRGMWIKNIDLSGLTNVVELNTDFTGINTMVERSWNKLIEEIGKKVSGQNTNVDLTNFFKDNNNKLIFEAFKQRLLDGFNGIITAIGGRLLTNSPKNWKEYIHKSIPNSEYKNFGFYTDVTVTKRPYEWDKWIFNGKKLNLYWWIEHHPIGEYLTQNYYQKNYITFRNVSSWSGSVFLGIDYRESTITTKVNRLSFSQWRDQLTRNEQDKEGTWSKKIQVITNWVGFNPEANTDSQHTLRAIFHKDIFKFEENYGGRITEIKPFRGITLIPDYENAGYVLAEYKTSEKANKTKIPNKLGGTNQFIVVNELLDHINPVKNYDITKPDEKLLTMTEWQNVSHSIRLGTLVKRLLLPPENDDKERQAKIRYKKWRWYKPGDNDSYSDADEYEYFIKYYIPNIPKRWNWRVTFPVNCAINVMKILEKYRDVSDNNFAYFNGSTKQSKGITNYKTYYFPVFDLNQADYLNVKEFTKIETKEVDNTIYVFIDVHPKSSASEDEKARLKLLIEEIHTAFFRSAWSENIIYQSTNIVGNVKKWIYAGDDGEKINYWSMSNLRPYRGLWYSSRILINQKAEKSLGVIEQWYEQRKNDYIFTFAWSTYGSNSMYLSAIGNNFIYSDNNDRYITWKEYLNNLYTMGQADRLEDSPNGILTQDFITWQDENGYKWHWTNHSRDLNKRYERQKKLGKNFICMETIKNKSITVTDKNLENPKFLKLENYRMNDKTKILSFYGEEGQEIPDYVWKYLDPNNPISELHKLEKIEPDNDVKKLLNPIFEKFTKALMDMHIYLRSSPVYFDLVGTNFIALATYSDNMDWTFELIPKTNTGVLIKEGRQKCTFTNFKVEEDTTIKAINSITELNVYGHKLPLKERFTLEGQNIPIECEIEKIHDKYQSPSDWYYLEVKSKTDYIRTQLEIPKEKTITTNLALHDKQKLFNEYIYNNANRYWENEKYKADKANFFRGIRREEKYQYHDIASDVIGGLAGAAGNVLSIRGLMGLKPGLGAVAGGLGFGLGLVNSIYQTIVGHQKRSEERAERLTHGLRSFQIQGETMAQKHKAAEEADRITLMNLANNNRYPEFNNSIIFEEMNKLIGRTNVYLSRYSPKDELLQTLKEHYDEYGFDLFLNEQYCSGVESIKKIVQYQTIKKNIHPNSVIREMIEQRLLTGIKIISRN